MAEKFVKPIREIGIVISKKHVEAREAGESFDGSRKWDARPESFVVEVISCDEDDFNVEEGILNGTRLEYSVPKDIYDKVKFADWAKVKYTANQFGDNKVKLTPSSFALYEK